MATGPENYAAAEKLIRDSRGITADDLEPAQLLTAVLAEAQVRATLALAAATALSENGAMPGADFDAWAKVCSTDPTPTSRLTVWWLDDGQENPGKPPLFTTDSAAYGAAIDCYCEDNPLSDPDSDDVAWLPPEEEDDEGGDVELSIRGRRTGIFVRPVRPKDGD